MRTTDDPRCSCGTCPWTSRGHRSPQKSTSCTYGTQQRSSAHARAEAKMLPQVVVADINPRKYDSRQTFRQEVRLLKEERTLSFACWNQHHENHQLACCLNYRRLHWGRLQRRRASSAARSGLMSNSRRLCVSARWSPCVRSSPETCLLPNTASAGLADQAGECPMATPSFRCSLFDAAHTFLSPV
jgi:hypothetical protein